MANEMGMPLPALKGLDEMKVTNVISHSFGVVAVRKTGSGLEEYISNLVLAQEAPARLAYAAVRHGRG